MTLGIDHIVIAVSELDQAARDYRDLGFTVLPGGVHANKATHNALICLGDGTYMELLARTGAVPAPDMLDFSPLLDKGEGLAGFALGSDNLEADAARLKANAFSHIEIAPGERRRLDGTIIRWKLMHIDGSFTPFFIQDLTPRNLRVPDDSNVTTHANRVVGLRGVKMLVRSIDAAVEHYTRLLGLQPRERQARDYQEIELSRGSLILSQPGQETSTALPDGAGGVLYAVEVLQDHASDNRFTLDKTHNVRFEQSPD